MFGVGCSTNALCAKMGPAVSGCKSMKSETLKGLPKLTLGRLLSVERRDNEPDQSADRKSFSAGSDDRSA